MELLDMIKSRRMYKIIVKNFISNGSSLRRKIIRGGFWSLTLRVLIRLSTLIKTILLARFLSPEDFGLVGLALLAISTMNNLSNLGTDYALIHNSKSTKELSNTAWTIKVLKGVVITIILFATAPYIGYFFRETRVIPLIQFLSLSQLLISFRHVGIVYYRKKLDLKEYFIYEGSGTFIDLLVSISLAVIYRSPWSLVLGYFSGHLVRLVASHLLMETTLKLQLKLKQLKFLGSYGVWFVFANIFNFLSVQGDDIYVGRVLGVSTLGTYQLIYKISNTLVKEFVAMVSDVMVASLAQLQNDFKRLRKYFSIYIKFNFIINIIIFIVLYLSLPFIQVYILGSEWIQIVDVGRILLVAGLIRSLSSVYGALYLAIGETKVRFYKQLLRAIFTFSPFIVYNGPNLEQVSWFVVFGLAIALGFDLLQAYIILPRKYEKTS
jgi:PST family polysaccharide transporter